MSSIGINKLVKFLNGLFPEEKAEEWDNVGFEIEEVYNLKNVDTVSNIIVCMDITSEVIDYAIEKNSSFIITRHPFFFKDIPNDSLENKGLKNKYKQEILKKAIEHSIQFYSIHTNYDWSKYQIAFNILDSKIKIKEFVKYEDSNGLFRIKSKNKIKKIDLINKIKGIYKSEKVNININSDNDQIIDEFFICSGAAGSLMVDKDLKNITYITGEVKWNEWIFANQNNNTLIEVGHYMENIFIRDIKEKLEKEFKDCVKIYDFDIKNQFKSF
ncbi:Nif3-like dinuclear metal center hexameric protein [Spiroplasma endosymbiont of Aspidapion aeneum]|uniref:Nif3-like dinuclear metal center hexameric protein n=1 Tax=Spiroplasma endosymbiont of Aspidapion aeneum TaxID=3066276 RepID=UPI00313D10CF